MIPTRKGLFIYDIKSLNCQRKETFQLLIMTFLSSSNWDVHFSYILQYDSVYFKLGLPSVNISRPVLVFCLGGQYGVVLGQYYTQYLIHLLHTKDDLYVPRYGLCEPLFKLPNSSVGSYHKLRLLILRYTDL